MEKTVLEIINDGYTGKKYIHECGTVVYVDCENTLRFDYRKSNRKPSSDAIGSRIVLDMKLKEYRKEYTFVEAFKAFEEGKEVENCEECRFKLIDKDNTLIIDYAGDEMEYSNKTELFSVKEIRGKWYINE